MTIPTVWFDDHPYSTIDLMTIPHHKNHWWEFIDCSSDFAVFPHSQPEDAAPTDEEKK